MQYRIRVQGHLDPGWQARFAGLRIEPQASGATVLSGPLPDQAALQGILLQIVRLGLTLLALDSDADGPSPKEMTTMGKVVFGLSVSLDGFIADPQGDPALVFAWMGRGMAQFFAVAGEDLAATGAVIMGHRSFDQIDGDQGWVLPTGTPIAEPVVVLQSQSREPVTKGQTPFYFVTDGIERAVKQGRELAGEKNVALHGASAVQQALRAGLLDEMHLSVAHVLLGAGVRLFDHLGSTPIPLEHLRTLETPGATHLSFRVVK